METNIVCGMVHFYYMATHTNETGENLIIFRIIFRKERRDLFTGIYRIKADWDSNSGLVFETKQGLQNYH